MTSEESELLKPKQRRRIVLELYAELKRPVPPPRRTPPPFEEMLAEADRLSPSLPHIIAMAEYRRTHPRASHRREAAQG